MTDDGNDYLSRGLELAMLVAGLAKAALGHLPKPGEQATEATVDKMREELLEAREKSLDLKEVLLDVRDEALDLRQKVKELEAQLNRERTLVFHENAYYEAKDEARAHPVCSPCWDSKQDFVRLHFLGVEESGLGKWRCPSCGGWGGPRELRVRSYKPAEGPPPFGRDHPGR